MQKTTLIENKSYEHAGFLDPKGTCPPPPFRGRAGEGVKIADASVSQDRHASLAMTGETQTCSLNFGVCATTKLSRGSLFQTASSWVDGDRLAVNGLKS